MREYGKIKTSFWSSLKVRSLSDDAKLLFTYLVACPYGNSIGCFVLPLGYIVEDLGWTTEKTSERIRELVSNGFIERDEHARVVRIVAWWEHNGIENGNVGKSVRNVAQALPTCGVSVRAIRDICSLGHRFLTEYRTDLEALLNDSGLSSESVSPVFRNNEPEPEPETEPEPEPRAALKMPVLHDAVEQVLAAAQLRENTNGLDGPTVRGWLQRGARLREDVIPTIERITKYRMSNGKKLPGNLQYYTEAIFDDIERRKGSGPPVKPEPKRKTMEEALAELGIPSAVGRSGQDAAG